MIRSHLSSDAETEELLVSELGTLARIDARTVWGHEAHHFTPWLRDHIDVLSAALGLDLDLVASEVRVGPFAADLLAKDVASDRWVVIENQLEPTDHSHLGQLLTYGAGTEASVFVWISPQFREEHRAALDWLNEHSDNDSAFFGIEIELVTIDGSRPAPNFKLVSFPNEWRKDGPTKTGGVVSAKSAAYTAFWSELLSQFKAAYPHETNATKAPKDSWFALSIGRSGFQTSWGFTGDRRFRIELYIDTGEHHFDELFRQKSEVETQMGHPLDWDRIEGKRACRASSYYSPSPISVTDPGDVLDPLTVWAITEMKRFRDVFRARILALTAPAAPLNTGDAYEDEAR